LLELSNQTPPMFSALKHKGQPLYKFAREGVKIERQQREDKNLRIKIIKLSKKYYKIRGVHAVRELILEH
jgi:tRNA pseudouridine55 synthase